MAAESTPTQGSKNRKIIINLDFTWLLTLFFLLIAAMAAAYILGVMTGRADTPVQHKEVSLKAPPEPVEEKGEILQAHELEFTRVLRGEKPAPKTDTASVETESKPIPQKPEAQSAEPDLPLDSMPKPETPGIQYDYSFQVAALKDEQSVDNLRQQLEGRGLRTSMERSGKVYLVMVLMRGEESRVAELTEICRELHLGEPLQRIKKPVMP